MELTKWISPDDLVFLSAEERHWLGEVFSRFSGFPNLDQIWSLIDDVWKIFGCDPEVMDERISAFYSHPVWLLNGLFIEQHLESLANREEFSNWVAKQAPQRVADFGGGFGTLARMIGQKLRDITVEVIEPHPHPLAIARAEKTPNVRYQKKLIEQYDVIVATDVFEHVFDPLQLVYDTAQCLCIGGKYLIANCFFPVILCHLPQTFHLRYSWDAAMKAMGLDPSDKVAYGRAYVRRGELNLEAARQVERYSIAMWQYNRFLPGRLARPMTRVLLFLLNRGAKP
ncbi:hypothetical protein NIES2134_107650 [Thermostichus vulcanus NIES-2134]|nr:hypothetical protein NIES2134_107650 [Thermostichus vulcanus NIES-2134]